MLPFGTAFFFLLKQWCTFLLVLLVTGKLPYFLGYESKLSLVFEIKRREKTIVILFQKYKGGCSDSNLSTSWERGSRWGQRAPILFLSMSGQRIPWAWLDALHRLEQLVGIIRESTGHLPSNTLSKERVCKKRVSIISMEKLQKK